VLVARIIFITGPDAAKDRLAMLSALGAALAADGLRVKAADLWSGFRISTQSGRFENAQNLGSGLIAQSQKATAAAMQIAEK
jgi:hypothetical protein